MENKKSIWRNRNFSTYALSRFISNLGTSFYMIALPLLVYQITNSGIAMGLMGLFETLPLLLGPFVGTLVDRFNRKYVLIISSIAQSILTLLIPFFYYYDFLTVNLLFFIGFLLGLFTIFLRSAEFAIIPSLFKNDITEANAGLSLMWTLSQLLGPALAGLFLVSFNPITLILINGISFIFPAITILFINEKMNVEKSNKKFFEDLKAGFLLIKNSQTLIFLALILFISNLADNGLIIVLVYHLKNTLGLSDSYSGFVLVSLGIGAILGSLIYPKFKEKDPLKIFLLGFLISAASTLLLLIPIWYVIPFTLFFAAIGGVLVGISQNVFLQQTIQNSFLGRVNATFRMISLAARPLSMFLLVFIAENYSTYLTFVFVASLNLLAVLLTYFILIKNKNPKKIVVEEV